MITKLEAGHRYRDSVLGVFIYLDEDEDGHLIYGPGSMGITGMQRHRLDLTTLVEVCYVDGEEMVVGEKYYVSDDSQEDASSSKDERTFFGTVNGQPVFRGLVSIPYRPWEYYVRVDEHAPTYHLVKSIDGQEVSRVEVSGEKARELGE